MTAAVATKCPECGQVVAPAQVLVYGELQQRLFTGRPAIVYTIESPGYHTLEGDGEEHAVRYRPDLKLYLYHEAVCPRRQVVQVPGASTCRSCPASVTFVRSPAGALLPLDARPLTVYELDDTHLVPQMVEHATKAELYLSHFASCPNAGLHSKGKAK